MVKRFLLAALLALTLHGLFFGFVPIAFDRKPPKKPHIITLSLASYHPVKPKPAARPAKKSPEKKQDAVIRPLPEKKAPEKPQKTLSVKRDKVKPSMKVEPPKEKKAKPLKSVKKPQKKVAKPRKKIPKPRKKATKPKMKPKAPARTVMASVVPEIKKVPETPPPSTHISASLKKDVAVPIEEAVPVEKTFELFPDIPEDIEVEKETKFASIPPVKKVREARPAYKDNPRPQYPKRARRRGYEGTVVLEVLVDGNGRVKELRIITSSGHAALDKAALKSVNGWLFEPGMVGDEKVDMWVRVPVRFELRGG